VEELADVRPQPLAAGCERLAPDLGHDPVVAPDRNCQPFLELGEICVEAGGLTQLGERAHRAPAVCSATMPPANVRWRTASKRAAAISADSSSGPGKRRTLAGRYVYADPPGTSLPSSGITASNQSR